MATMAQGQQQISLLTNLLQQQQQQQQQNLKPMTREHIQVRDTIMPLLGEVKSTHDAYSAARDAGVSVLKDLVTKHPECEVRQNAGPAPDTAALHASDWRARAQRIPTDTRLTTNRAFTKVTLQPPMKWKVSHVHTRDPVQFLKEVWHYAQCARQDAVVTLGRYLEEPASKAYDMVVEKAGLVSRKDAVELFGRLVRTDLHNPEYEATMRLTRGEVRQGKSQTVLEYATVFQNVALAAASDIPGWVLCDKFLSGLSVPELQRECTTPLNGGRWDDLQACITHVLT